MESTGDTDGATEDSSQPPAGVTDALLWRSAQPVLSRHPETPPGEPCPGCGAISPCVPRWLAERAVAVASNGDGKPTAAVDGTTAAAAADDVQPAAPEGGQLAAAAEDRTPPAAARNGKQPTAVAGGKPPVAGADNGQPTGTVEASTQTAEEVPSPVGRGRPVGADPGAPKAPPGDGGPAAPDADASKVAADNGGSDSSAVPRPRSEKTARRRPSPRPRRTVTA